MRGLLRQARYRYHTMTPEEYLFNQRDSNHCGKPQAKSLEVLPNSNQGPENVMDEIGLIGVPKHQFPDRLKSFDTLQEEMMRHDADLFFLQVDPSEYIARERFAAHKCAMNKVEDYYLDGVERIDPLKPHTWEETVVNLLTMDMIVQNKIPSEMNFTKGFYTYSHDLLQEKGLRKQLTEPFINAISEHILGGTRTGYYFIDKVLYTTLMGKQRVMLGGMPETLRRLILGNSLSIHEMRDIFRFVLAKNKELTIPMSTKDATQNFLPHIFQLPKDLYMTALLKEAFQASTDMLAFVGIEHWKPIQKYWVGAPHGINYTQATRIPDRLEGQIDEDLIEKQAIMDVLMDSKVWSKDYLSNPFPYLINDITRVREEDTKQLKGAFKKHYTKYKLFKDKETKQISSSSEPVGQLEHKQQEQITRVQESIAGGADIKKFTIRQQTQPNSQLRN